MFDTFLSQNEQHKLGISSHLVSGFITTALLSTEPTSKVFVCVLNRLLGQDLHPALLHPNHLWHRHWNFYHTGKQLYFHWCFLYINEIFLLEDILSTIDISCISTFRALLVAFARNHFWHVSSSISLLQFQILWWVTFTWLRPIG